MSAEMEKTRKYVLLVNELSLINKYNVMHLAMLRHGTKFHGEQVSILETPPTEGSGYMFSL